ncbi:ABC transporter permease [Streptacidiphilus sp. N1-3]|uniref:Transport permease protein n=1 Tax=Streptacidiphilus alkalitolerans TaxID=3342712 RepID=A0ABV6X5R9_9ACTN
MSTTTIRTTGTGRIRALGRAELTLLWRNRVAMATALLLPLAMVLGLRPALSKVDFKGSGLNPDSMSISGGIGFVLAFAVYYNLVTAYVARREELVLKRLRTGEATDLEILAGTALPTVALALAQCAVLLAAGALLLTMDPPHRPDLLLAGLLLAPVLLAALAAASTVFTRTVELAQFTTAPLLLVIVLGSGLILPLDELPRQLAEVCRYLPMTPVMDLIRAGLVGGPGARAGQVLESLGLALAWTVVAVLAAQRWFRWEPRR